MSETALQPFGRRLCVSIAVLSAIFWNVAANALDLEQIRLPNGFEIEIYAAGLTNARQMALGDRGTLFVGSRTAGKIYAVSDLDQDGSAETKVTVARGLTMPTGLAFRDGALYVGAVSRVLRYDGIEDRLNDPPDPVVITDHLPSETHHGWKYLGFAPDGRLYVPVGAPCNVCENEGPYASILAMDADGANQQVFARGVRNSVGFDFHPVTGDLWFTDNGRDNLGDDIPPCELNHAPQAGLHFGFPYCHGGIIPDRRYGAKRACSEFTPPAQALGPHVAPLGMKFYTGDMFPPEYHHQIFIAEHGSWNRSTKIGYRITLVRLDGSGRAIAYEPFAEGWLQGQRAWGRPADVLVMPDGALLVADDTANVIYRISYKG